jgi:RNA polymerase sigma factor (sigma-70 family)
LSATVRSAAAGEAPAWETLTRRYEPMLRRVAGGYRLQAADVDDALQNCWLQLFTGIHTLREPAAVGGWLVTTMRRQSLRARQREVRELLVEEPLDSQQPAVDCVCSEVEEAELGAALREAVRRLDGRQRELLETLISAPDRSYAEVSADLDMPVGSIGPTRERGFARLRRDRELKLVVCS